MARGRVNERAGKRVHTYRAGLEIGKTRELHTGGARQAGGCSWQGWKELPDGQRSEQFEGRAAPY